MESKLKDEGSDVYSISSENGGICTVGHINSWYRQGGRHYSVPSSINFLITQ